jgi:peptide/nickel transport system permease protein
MRGYIVKRIIIGVIILFIIASLNFTIFQVIYAGDPTRTIIDPNFKKEQKDMLRVQFGLNATLQERYLKYIVNMFTWNFGFSFHTFGPIAEEMGWRIRNTLLLLGTVMIGTILLGTSVGILAGSRRGTKVDMVAMAAGMFADGVPAFFIQMIFLLFFCSLLVGWIGFSIFPSSRMMSTPPPTEILPFIGDVAWHLSLPALTLILSGFGAYALYVRNLMIDALTQDYILTARAKGLGDRAVLYRHAFRSVLPPIATIIALGIPGLITGAIITEYIFTWPGVGSWYIAALQSDDFPVVQAVLFIYAILTIICNLIADLLYGVLDPRVRVGMRR